MILPQVRYRKLSELPEFRTFEDYVVDVNGNVWSYKNRNPRILKPHIIRNGYLKVPLWNNNNIRKQCYVHRLVALCFIPLDSDNGVIIHKNGNLQDNRLENLEWNISRKNTKEKNVLITSIEGKTQYQVNEELTDKIEKVFYASQRKGLPSKNNDQFFNEIVNKALDDYINQYGLRKLLM